MKLFQYYADDAIKVGAVVDAGHVDVAAMAAREGVSLPGDIKSILADGKVGELERLLACEPILIEGGIRFAAPITDPEKMLCIGLNYAAHARETGAALPEAPVIFCKLPNAYSHHDSAIRLPAAASKYDYEAELVVVVGREASCVSQADAGQYIFGYTCGNDFSARDIQKRTSQWVPGKSMDGFGPTGPYLVSADSFNALGADISSYVNGQRRQHSNTSDLIFTPDFLVSDISQLMTLKPGDMIFTGTPSGVITGYPEQKQVWLKAGDVVEVEIEGIGRLRNTLE